MLQHNLTVDDLATQLLATTAVPWRDEASDYSGQYTCFSYN